MRCVDRVRSWAFRRCYAAGVHVFDSPFVKRDGRPSRTGTLGLIFILTFAGFDPAAMGAIEPRQRLAMTNADVIREVQLGDSDAEIKASIKKHQTAFSFDEASLAALKASGVSEDVQRAMFESRLGSKVAIRVTGDQPRADTSFARDADSASPRVAYAKPANPDLPGWCVPYDSNSIAFPIGSDLHHQVKPDTTQLKDRRGEVSLPATSSGAEIYTKSTVWVGYINRLRYKAALKGITTIIQPPAIPQTMFNGSAAASKNPNKPPSKSGESTFVESFDRDKFKQFYNCFTSLQDNLKNFEQNFTAINKNHQDIVDELERQVDPVLNSAAAVRTQATTALDLSKKTSIFPQTDVPEFPSVKVSTFKARLDEFIKAYGDFNPSPDSPNRPTFDQVNAAAKAMSDDLGQYTPGSKEVENYNNSKQFIDYWFEKFKEVAEANGDFFIVDYSPSCGGWFGQGTLTQIQMSVVDEYKPTETIPTLELAKVVCQPTISISSGLALSFIPDQTPAFVPSFKKDAQGNPVLDANGNPMIVQSLGYSSQANVRPGYALQTNAAIWESPGGFFGFHWAAGAMLTASTGGVTTDIITGPAFSFRRRTFYISPVYDLGLRTQYLSQFGLGIPQGTLTSPPTHQLWKSGFGLTITFPFNSTTTQQESSKAGDTQPTPKPAPKKN